VRLAFLVPAPDYPEPWRWAFDPEAAPLQSRGATVDPVVWTEPRDLSDYDLVMPLVGRGTQGLRIGVLGGWFRQHALPEALTAVDTVAQARIPAIHGSSRLVREGGLPHRCIIDEKQSAGDLLPILDASARTSFVAHLEAPYL